MKTKITQIKPRKKAHYAEIEQEQFQDPNLTLAEKAQALEEAINNFTQGQELTAEFDSIEDLLNGTPSQINGEPTTGTQEDNTQPESEPEESGEEPTEDDILDSFEDLFNDEQEGEQEENEQQPEQSENNDSIEDEQHGKEQPETPENDDTEEESNKPNQSNISKAEREFLDSFYELQEAGYLLGMARTGDRITSYNEPNVINFDIMPRVKKIQPSDNLRAQEDNANSEVLDLLADKTAETLIKLTVLLKEKEKSYTQF